MKKGLLIYRINKDDIGNSGIIKKCLGQLDAFRSSGMDVDIFWLSNKGIYKNNDLVHRQNLKPHSLSLYWFYLTAFGWHILKYNDFSKYDFIYLRHPFFDPILVKSFRKIKKEYPSIKILLEINTYPYEAEPKRLLHKISLWLDKLFRNDAVKFVDRIVNYGEEDSIWAVPTINIRNGIQVDDVAISKKENLNNEVRFIAVGNWSFWHGLDRLILGIKEYYFTRENECDVKLIIIGRHSPDIKIKELVQENNLEKHVTIVGEKYGKELDEYFDYADIGVGTLGIHRKGVQLDSSLKHREYCTRGIPFILAGKDPDFPSDLDFVISCHQSDEPINMQNVIDKYYGEEMSSRMAQIRNYAEEKLAWKAKLGPVFEWIIRSV